MTELNTTENKKATKHIHRALDDTIQLAMRIAEVRLAQDSGAGLDQYELASDLAYTLEKAKSWKAKKKIPAGAVTDLIMSARKGAMADAQELCDEILDDDDDEDDWEETHHGHVFLA